MRSGILGYQSQRTIPQIERELINIQLHIDILNVVLYTHKQAEGLKGDPSIQYVDYKDNMFKFYAEFSLSQVFYCIFCFSTRNIGMKFYK